MDQMAIRFKYTPERSDGVRQATFEGDFYAVCYDYLVNTFGGREEWLRIASELTTEVKRLAKQLGTLDNPQFAAYYFGDSPFPNSIFIEEEKDGRVVIKDMVGEMFSPDEEDLMKV